MENRAENFVEVLRSIKKGNMKDNIHFQMLLDVGRRIKQKNPRGIRYSEKTKKFWLAFSKLGKGKMIHFMAGGRKGGKIMIKLI